jgi:hypothetical protein
MAADIKVLLASAPFSFIGTVLHLGAATTASVPVDGRTAVVHVDHVLHAPDAFSRLEGQQITVQLSAAVDPPTAGESHAFFARGLAFGDSIAVSEVGRLPVESVQSNAQSAVDAGLTAGAFDGLLREMKHDYLRAHAKLVAAVVIGRVIAITKVGTPAFSEHDPDWWCATIEIDHVERGPVEIGAVRVLFANSHDVRWHQSPKPFPGQSGLWLLHRSTANLESLAPFQILEAVDIQPTQQLEVLRNSGV